MTVKTLESNPEKVGDKMICESCGEEFLCGVNIGKCWCFAVELEAETLAGLRRDFRSCLCEHCLETFGKNTNVKTLK